MESRPEMPKPIMTVEEEEEMPTLIEATPPTLVQTEISLPTPEVAAKLENQRKEMPKPDTDKLMDAIDKQSQKEFTFPPVRYPITVEHIVDLARKSFLTHATQPNFNVLATRPGVWAVNRMPASGADVGRIPFKEFSTNIRSLKTRKRMYANATFANLRLMGNALTGYLIGELSMNKESAEITCGGEEKSKRIRGTKMFMAMVPYSGLSTTLVCGRTQQPLEKASEMRITAWFYLAGGGWIEVDIENEAQPVKFHDTAPATSYRIRLDLAIKQAAIAMNVRKEKYYLQNMVNDLTAAVETYNVEKKKEKVRERRRRRRKKKREHTE